MVYLTGTIDMMRCELTVIRLVTMQMIFSFANVGQLYILIYMVYVYYL